jgi:hypothetical protein
MKVGSRCCATQIKGCAAAQPYHTAGTFCSGGFNFLRRAKMFFLANGSVPINIFSEEI